jgi:tRNA (cytidine/uridine-2'-O-)-methyltransferase
MEIVLVAPEIPHNSGCAGRLSAALGLRLHLVEPLGFSLEDRYMKRAGLDYWPQVELAVHRDWSAAVAALDQTSQRPIAQRLRLFTARGGGSSLFETDFAADDVYIPIRPGVRSLNLANVVCLATYTALVRAGVDLPDNDGRYEPHPRASEDVWPASRVL